MGRIDRQGAVRVASPRPKRNRRPEVVVFSTVASQDRPATWRVVIRGAVYEAETETLQKRLLLRLLRKVMQLTPAELDSHLFRERVRYFVAKTERGYRVTVRLGDRRFLLPKRSRRNGQFRGVIRIGESELQMLRDSGAASDDYLSVRVGTLGQSTESEGRVYLVARSGWSVISDIDDTIKVSSVTDRKELLANTFLRPFRTIDGMAERYRQWARQGVAFHYVSASPWQLHHALTELCGQHGFPTGSFHLRSFRLRDHMLRRVLLIRRMGKGAAIRQLLKSFPGRRFVLIGDSGERDPELYAAAARRFPRQVAAIYIRQLPEKPLERGRAERMFRNLPASRWLLFEDASQLPERLDQPETRSAR